VATLTVALGRATGRRFPTGRSLAPWLGLATAWTFVLGASPFQRNLIVSISILAVAVAGLNLLIGHAGQVSLASGLFVGVGAYTTAWLGADHGMPIIVSIGSSFAAAALIGALLGPAALRVRGNNLAVVTFGALLIGEYVFEQWRSLTGGNAGRSIAGAASRLDGTMVALPFREQPRAVVWAWITTAVALLAVLGCRNIVASAAGRALRAVRDHRWAAAVMTVDERRATIAAFAFTSGLAGLAGSLYGSFQGFVAPSEFGLASSLSALTAAVVGGIGTTWGPIFGAAVVGGLPRLVEAIGRATDIPFVSGDRGGAAGHVGVATLTELLTGVLLVAVLVLEPGGIVGLLRRVGRLVASRPHRPPRQEKT
jgi:branched-chain amino acid transport system permease protein